MTHKIYVTYGLGQNVSNRGKAARKLDVEQRVAAKLAKDPKNATLSDRAWLELVDKEVEKATAKSERRSHRAYTPRDRARAPIE